MLRRIIVSLAALAAVLLVPAGASAAGCRGASRPAQAQSSAAAARAVLCAVNRQRAAAGLRRMHASRLLRVAALRHSRDMVRRRFFDHVSPSGSTLGTRVAATGWTRAARHGYSLGEAIGWAGGGRATPASMVAMWMASPPHRAILMNPGFDQAGIGVVHGTPAPGTRGATFTLDAGHR